MLHHLARFAYRRRRTVVVAWLALVVVAVTLGGRFGGDDTTDYGTPGSESSNANDLVADRFPAGSGDTINVVWQAPDVTAAPVQAGVRDVLDQAAGLDHVIGVVQGPMSEDGTVGYATLQLDTWDMPVEVTDELLAIADEADGDGFTVDVGGNPVQTAEQGEVSSEGIGLIVAAVILLVSFGSVLAMGLPILSAILGVGVASGLIALLANLVDVPDWATSVATMIAIGVGIDYSLLIVTRYRAALQRGLDPEAAVGEAVGTAGRAVVFAGVTVMVSLLGMIVMNLPYLYGVAIGSALAVGVMVALSVTLLPAVLGFVGTNIDRLRVPFVKANRPRPSLAYPVEPGDPASAVAGGDRRTRAAPRARRAGAVVAARLPRRRQRPRVTDQPPRLRHPHRRLRTGPQRHPARRRRPHRRRAPSPTWTRCGRSSPPSTASTP